MQPVKRGDVIVVVVHYGGVKNVVDVCIAREDVNPEDMYLTDVVIDTDKPSGGFGWGVSPADLFLHAETLGPLAGDVPKKVAGRVRKKGYWWELRANVQIPARSRRSRVETYYET
jgi:hypothetical protein